MNSGLHKKTIQNQIDQLEPLQEVLIFLSKNIILNRKIWSVRSF